MKKIMDTERLNFYFEKYDIAGIFDKDIIRNCRLHFYKKGDTILESGYNLEYYYMLVEGQVKIFYTFENGKSMTLKFYKEFNHIGDIELLKNVPVHCDVEAVEDSYLIAIPASILKSRYMDNLNFIRHLANSLGDKLFATINNSSYNFVYPLANRLASYLAERLDGNDFIVLDSALKDIADFLGTTYRHLGRTFNELEAQSIIRLENKKVFILDREKLEDLAKNIYIK